MPLRYPLLEKRLKILDGIRDARLLREFTEMDRKALFWIRPAQARYASTRRRFGRRRTRQAECGCRYHQRRHQGSLRSHSVYRARISTAPMIEKIQPCQAFCEKENGSPECP